MADLKTASQKASPVTCPGCGYIGHGFNYVELVPNVSPTVAQSDGTLLARLERGELRFDEIKEENEYLECPECQQRFAAPAFRIVVAPRD